jgi:hypothetical protein
MTRIYPLHAKTGLLQVLFASSCHITKRGSVYLVRRRARDGRTRTINDKVARSVLLGDDHAYSRNGARYGR